MSRSDTYGEGSVMPKWVDLWNEPNATFDDFIGAALKNAVMLYNRGDALSVGGFTFVEPGIGENVEETSWVLEDDALHSDERILATSIVPNPLANPKADSYEIVALAVDPAPLGTGTGTRIRFPARRGDHGPTSWMLGKPSPREPVELPDRSVPRYAHWGMDEFTSWVGYKMIESGARAQEGGPKRFGDKPQEISTFTGYAFISADRTFRETYTRGYHWKGKPAKERWRPGEESTKAILLEQLAEKGNGAGSLVAWWWTQAGTTTVRFIDCASGQALEQTWKITPPGGTGRFMRALGVATNTVSPTSRLVESDYRP